MAVSNAFTSNKSSTAIGELDDDGRLDVTSSFQRSVHSTMSYGGEARSVFLNLKSGWLFTWWMYSW
jgi:hypothetical protein